LALGTSRDIWNLTKFRSINPASYPYVRALVFFYRYLYPITEFNAPFSCSDARYFVIILLAQHEFLCA
jgi:hypothetical protein